MSLSKWFIINRYNEFQFKAGKLKGFTVHDLYSRYEDKFLDFLNELLEHPETLPIDRTNIRDILKEIKGISNDTEKRFL